VCIDKQDTADTVYTRYICDTIHARVEISDISDSINLYVEILHIWNTAHAYINDNKTMMGIRITQIVHKVFLKHSCMGKYKILQT
jgi:hypothetical protein